MVLFFDLMIKESLTLMTMYLMVHVLHSYIYCCLYSVYRTGTSPEHHAGIWLKVTFTLEKINF